MDRSLRRQTLERFLRFLQWTNQHPLSMRPAEVPIRFEEYLEEVADSASGVESARWYELASEAEKAQFFQEFQDYLPVLREEEARGFHFTRTPWREASGQQKGASMEQQNRQLPEDFEELVQENPAGAFTKGVAHQINQYYDERDRQKRAKKPGFFARVGNF